MKEKIVLSVNSLQVYFSIKQGLFRRSTKLLKVVDNISFNLYSGKTLAILGESGCGKSTIAKAILSLIKAKSGTVFYENTNLLKLNSKHWRSIRKDLQIIFQDPFSAMNPKLEIKDILIEGLRIHNICPKEKYHQYIDDLLEKVGLPVEYKNRYPHEFSGGQRQRICIARALSVNPKVIICDEPTSALDVSVQAQVLNLLKDLQKKHSMTYLFISHDISVVKYMADYVAVMHLGKIVEYGSSEDILTNPKHPYTKLLLKSVPVMQQ
ncbi:MAG: ABC transporter ATP-binding protein [Romboutsia sp.]|nr:ABC transporter ATP-binding protein [Romboutsia sp.]